MDEHVELVLSVLPNITAEEVVDAVVSVFGGNSTAETDRVTVTFVENPDTRKNETEQVSTSYCFWYLRKRIHASLVMVTTYSLFVSEAICDIAHLRALGILEVLRESAE